MWPFRSPRNTTQGIGDIYQGSLARSAEHRHLLRDRKERHYPQSTVRGGGGANHLWCVGSKGRGAVIVNALVLLSSLFPPPLFLPLTKTRLNMHRPLGGV